MVRRMSSPSAIPVLQPHCPTQQGSCPCGLELVAQGSQACLTCPRSPCRERRHTRACEPGWHPEATTALPTGRTPAVFSVLPGEWASTSRTAGAPTLGPTGEGTSGPGRLWVKGCVWWILCPPAFLSPHAFLGAALGGPWIRLCPGQADHPLPPQGKVFPKLRKRTSMRSMDVEEMGTGRAADYVFRIIYPGHRHEHSECPDVHPWRRERYSGWWGSTASPRRGSRQGPLARPGRVEWVST